VSKVIYKDNINQVLNKIKITQKQLFKRAQLGMIKGMREFETDIITKQMSGRQGNSGLDVGTGALRRSWHITSFGERSSFTVRLGTSSKYARIHQYGGIIKPKKSKYLAIPLRKEARGKSPREFDDLHIRKVRGKDKFVLIKKRARKAHYVLQRSVEMPKRLRILERFRTKGWQLIDRQVVRSVTQVKGLKRKSGVFG